MDKDVMCYHNDSISSGDKEMPNLLIRNVPVKTLNALKSRAKKNKRSVQAEVSAILDREAKATAETDFWELAARIREELKGTVQTDSAELIREDRDSR